MRKVTEEYDVVVVGGGVAGVAAALAAARHGCRTCLAHDRPVLGGNASSEIRVGIEGAEYEFRHARETGIIEEIRIEDRRRNYHRSINGATNHLFDTVLLELVAREENLTLHLNTTVFKAHTSAGSIEVVEGLQCGTETMFQLRGDLFIDSSGDGVVAAEAGAGFRTGREGAAEFGESLAPDEPDRCSMGSSLMFHVVNRGRIVKFTPPDWAYDFPVDEDLWEHNYGWGHTGPYVWVEAGGDELDTLHDNEAIMDELRKSLYGVWDHIKNHGNHHAENLEIDWVGAIPGKRESRRIAGDHILTQGDIEARTPFDDRVAYGGWPMDIHTPGGLRAKMKSREASPATLSVVTGLYSIPFRCYYSASIDNLMMAGRNISATHAALGSARIIATCAVGGQVVGTAAALCKRHGRKPRQLAETHIAELQQTLLKDDCYIIRLPNADERDLARGATLTGSSTMKLEVAGRGPQAELNVARGQMIFVTDKRLDTVELDLRNSTDERKSLDLQVLRADLDDKISGESSIRDVGNLADVSAHPGGFAHPEPVATAAAALGPGEARWVTFRVDAAVGPGAYWVLLSAREGIYWRGSDEIVPGLVAIYEVPGRGWSYARHQLLRVKVGPASYPFGPENVTSGVARAELFPNIWISDPSRGLPQHVDLDLGAPRDLNTVHLTFDTNLDHFPLTAPCPETAGEYRLLVRHNKRWRCVLEVRDNYRRKRVHSFPRVTARWVRLVVERTNGAESARVYEMRLYDEDDAREQ